MRYLGFPGGILAFLLIYSLPAGGDLSGAAQAGAACFTLALVWWVTEPFPTYVTSLALMFLLLITRSSSAKAIMDVLGMEVIWLNLLAFIPSASRWPATRLANGCRFGSSSASGTRRRGPRLATPNLQLNLAGISVLSSMTMTGSSANLIAVGLIQTMGGHRLYYMDWVRVGRSRSADAADEPRSRACCFGHGGRQAPRLRRPDVVRRSMPRWGR
jgi:di/tricarboxylate transporter